MSKTSPEPKRQKPVSRKGKVDGKIVLDRDWHWVYNLIPVGLIFGLISTAFLSEKTLMDVESMLRIAVVCLFGGLLIPQKIYRKYFTMGTWATVMLNLLGIGPIVFALLGWANYLVVESSVPFRWPIESYIVHDEQDYLESAYVEVNISDPNVREFPSLARFELEDFDPKATHVRMEIATGALGVKVLKSRELIVP